MPKETAAAGVEEPIVSEAVDTEEVVTPKKKGKAIKKKANGGYNVNDICDQFMYQSLFFENSIVREQVFQLRAL